uniref:Uncharacterized protein n=1 Tax=Megaselia scalaris TaxID=36166 RepID=T1GJG5_MEGSC
MKSHDQNIITPGGMDSGVNPSATAASGTRILEVPTTMSEELNLSEEDRMLGEDSSPNDKPGKKVHSAEEQAVIKYKNRLRKAKFYVEKANKINLTHEVPTEYQLRSDGWAMEIMAKEEERKRVPEPTSFRSHRGDNASRGTPKAINTEKRRHDQVSSTPFTSKAKDEAKNQPIVRSIKHLNPIVRNIDKLPFNEIVKLNLNVSLVDANAADLKMNMLELDAGSTKTMISLFSVIIIDWGIFKNIL